MDGDRHHTAGEHKDHEDKKIDKAADLSFPASDPTAHGPVTGT